MPWRRLVLSLSLGSLFFATPLASSAAEENPLYRPVLPERRNGVVLGMSAGVGFAGASGYPNNAKFLGDPAYYSESPLLVGWSTSYFLMGALTDYLSFGPLLNISTFDTPDWKSTGWGLGFRGEVFPLMGLARKTGLDWLADTAAYGQVGFGTTELRAKGPYPTADGSQTFLGFGVHQEFRLFRMLGGHAAAGPHVEYDVIRSEPAERHWLTVGLRVAWYGGRLTGDH
jgi:hypothetical protein